MATLTLKNVPEKLLERLRNEAKQRRRSLNQETLLRLERSLTVHFPSPEEKVELIRHAQARFADLAPFDDDFLTFAKSDGRP